MSDTIVIDLDNTITVGEKGKDYASILPNKAIVEKIKEYRTAGYQIIIHTSRNMRTYEKDIAKINAHTLPVIIEWLNRHDVPFDGVVVGKPWCGNKGFYVDDRCVRPSEFLSLSADEIEKLLEREPTFSIDQ